MKPLTIIVTFVPGSWQEKMLATLAASELAEEVVLISPEPINVKISKSRVVAGEGIQSRNALAKAIGEARTRYLLFLTGTKQMTIEPTKLEKFVATAESTKAGMVYSDFYDETEYGEIHHPLIDYQLGSVRDEFDFGSMILFSTDAALKAMKTCVERLNVFYSGFYDLRLNVSVEYSIYHLREPLYSVKVTGDSSGDRKLFGYVDPQNADAQKEMEAVFTGYLKRVGAYLHPGTLKRVENATASFPVEASVIIPVRNRFMTIADAVNSALSQATDFPFNVIVIDNHSTDKTTEVLSNLAGNYAGLKHIIPHRTNLGIGGCWNEAINSPFCGRYAIQLDSDDLYSTPGTIQTIVNTLRNGGYAMAIGSYTLVNFHMEVVPPGLIDHREWTDGNGHNNALRVNGLGAPRAFDTNIIRAYGFLNVNYGEDYAVALSVSREYRIGRIYESIYLCRRWEGNTDSALTLEEANRNDTFKDSIRTREILARQAMNQGAKT